MLDENWDPTLYLKLQIKIRVDLKYWTVTTPYSDEYRFLILSVGKFQENFPTDKINFLLIANIFYGLYPKQSWTNLKTFLQRSNDPNVSVSAIDTYIFPLQKNQEK